MIRLIDLLKEAKDPITIYRIENSDNLGPFRDEIAKLIKSKDANNYKAYKQLYNRISKKHKAVIVNVPKGYVFGYQSMNQLKDWFTESDLQLLKTYGFSIKKYNNVTQYYPVLDREVIFKK